MTKKFFIYVLLILIFVIFIVIHIYTYGSNNQIPIFYDKERNVISNTSGESRAIKLRNFLNKTYKGKRLYINKERVVFFVSKSSKEFAYPSKRITRKERALKEAISIDLQKVLQTAEFIDDIDYKRTGKKFEHYLVKFIVKKRFKKYYYDAILNIKKENDGRWIFYDLTKIKNIGNNRQINATPDVSKIIKTNKAKNVNK